jgi:hypothetical protein
LSDCFYNTRKQLDADGWDVTSCSERRKEVTKYVKTYCDKLGIKRHEIGIFAADRAVMAFRGESYSVSFENYEQLAVLGTDIICVEKEGIVDKLVPFTKDFGIALLQSQGFLSEFGEMLAHEAAKYGARVGMLTDFDSSRVDLAFSIKDITRLGINLGTIDEINAQRDKKKDKKLVAEAQNEVKIMAGITQLAKLAYERLLLHMILYKIATLNPKKGSEENDKIMAKIENIQRDIISIDKLREQKCGELQLEISKAAKSSEFWPVLNQVMAKYELPSRNAKRKELNKKLSEAHFGSEKYPQYF